MMMWPCKRFDLSWDDWLFAVESSLRASDREVAAARVEGMWSPEGDAIACLSVRSAFDLFLRAVDWSAGDEIVFSALTVPDMPAIARVHGLRCVPLDVDPLTTDWDPEELRSLMGPRTRAVVLTHLFGARLDVRPALEIAHIHGLAVIEDCAQAYAGREWTGHPDSDLRLFSFGPMKTATALGGGLARVGQTGLRHRMREILLGDPEQGGDAYLQRVLAFGALMAASHPSVFGAFIQAADLLGQHHEAIIHAATRSLSGGDLRINLRKRPAAALLSLLERRLAEDAAPVMRRIEPAHTLLDAIGPDVALPTRGTSPHSRWMVPVLCEAPENLTRELRARGYYAMSSRLAAVTDDRAPTGAGTSSDRSHAATPGARRLATQAVYIPFEPDMPDETLTRLGEAVTRFASVAQPTS